MKFFLNCLFLFFISTISKAQCPVIEGAMIHACGANEGKNEFVLFSTTVAATAGDYTFYYGDNSVPYLGLPVNILAGANATLPTGSGTITSTNGCIINQVTSAATTIPSNSKVLLIPSNFDANYDVTSICSSGSVYIVYINILTPPTIWNPTGVFANNSFTSGYLQITNSATMCTSEIRSYDNNWTTDIGGNTVWWDASGNANYNNNGCTIIAPAVTISNVVPSSVCAGNTATTVTYITSGNPDKYTLVWDAAANAAGFVDVTNAALTGSPLTIGIPALAAPASYNASLVVKNSISGISSVAQIFAITIDAQVIPGFSPVAAICSGSVAPVLPTTSVNGITGTWSPAVVSSTNSATYTFTPATGFCATTTSLSVVVQPLPTAFLIGTTTSCYGTSANVIFNGTPNVTVSYTINGGAIQTTTLNGVGSKILNSGILNTDLTYILESSTSAGLPGCTQALSGSIVITVLPQNLANISGSTTICAGTASNIDFTGTPNATVSYNVNGGAIKTILLDGTGNASVNTGNLIAAATYKLVSVLNAGFPACIHVISGTAIVTVNSLPTASISGTATICSGTSFNIDFSGTPNATVNYTINSGANQTVLLDAAGNASVGTGNLTADATYNLVSVTNAGVPACLNMITGAATVTVMALPTASIGAAIAICNGTSTNIIFSGTPNAIVTYNVDGITPYQSIILDGTGVATLNTGNLLVTRTYNLVSVANSGGVACLQNLSGSEVVTVYPVTNAPIVTPAIIYCQNEITNPLSATGNNLLWYTSATALVGAATAPTPNSTIAGSTDYYVTQTLNSCESIRTTITVTVNPTPVIPTVPLIAVYRCGTGPVALKATAPGMVRWYSDAALTTFLLAGPSYSPTISATTTFYVTNMEYGCVSPARAVIATIFPMVVQATGFNYSPSTICDGSPKAVPVRVSGFVLGGVYSSTPGLSINGVTGVVNPLASSPGTYTVKYAIGAAICTLAANSTTIITINKSTVPVTTFSYPSPVCTSVANPSPITAAGFVTGGVYSSTAGLTISTSTGSIDLSTSTGGTYMVTYTLNATACTTIGITTATITIVAPAAPAITGGVQRCGSGVVNLSATGLGTIKWYGDAGLTNLLNSGNGYAPIINTTTTYYVTNTEGLCVSPQSSVVATVIPVTTQITSFSYTPSTVCAGSTNPTPLTDAGFVSGGIYSSTLGLSLNSSTGVINPAISTPGTYIVKYAVPGYQCVLAGNSTSTILINKTTVSETTFSYPSPVCSSADNPLPLHSAGFTSKGTFSSSAGLVIDATSGVINLKTSTPGTYSITYTVTTSPCTAGGSSNAEIIINNAPAPPVTKGGHRCGAGLITLDATSSGSLNWYKNIYLNNALAIGAIYTVTVNSTTDFFVTASNGNCESEPTVVTADILPLPLKPDLGKIITLCEGDTVILSPGRYDSYLWQDNSNASTFAVTIPGGYALIVKGVNGCTNAGSISIVPSNTCTDILFPTAFSPNGDQLNDYFGPLPYRNLSFVTGYSLRIFNRYGQVVFATSNPYERWDGMYKGEMNDTGTFMWRADYIYNNGNIKSQKGNVVIVH